MFGRFKKIEQGDADLTMQQTEDLGFNRKSCYCEREIQGPFIDRLESSQCTLSNTYSMSNFLPLYVNKYIPRCLRF